MTAPPRVPDAERAIEIMTGAIVEYENELRLADILTPDCIANGLRRALSALTAAGLTLRAEGEVERENERLRAVVEAARTVTPWDSAIALYMLGFGALQNSVAVLKTSIEKLDASEPARAALGGKNEDH